MSLKIPFTVIIQVSIFIIVMCMSNVVAAQQRPKTTLQLIEDQREQYLEFLLIREFDSIRSVPVGRFQKFESLSLREQEFIAILQNDFHRFFRLVRHHEKFYRDIDFERKMYTDERPDSFKYVEPEKKDDFNRMLREMIESKYYEILRNNVSKLSELEFSFLQYYFSLVIFHNDYCNVQKQEKAIDDGKLFLQQYGGEEPFFDNFIKKYSSFFKSPGNWGWETSLFYSRGALSGNINEYLDEFRLNFGFQAGLSFGRWYTSYSISRAWVPIAQPFVVDDFLHAPPRIVNYNQHQISLGAHLFLGEKWLLTPLMDVGFHTFRAALFNQEVGFFPLFPRFTSFVYAPGFMLEYVFPTKKSCTNDFITFQQKRNNGWFIRLKSGYAPLNFRENDPNLTGQLLYFNLHIGSYLTNIKRERKL
jgi:hypothetical protein